MSDYELSNQVEKLCKDGNPDEAVEILSQIRDRGMKESARRQVAEAFCRIGVPEQAVPLLKEEEDRYWRERLAVDIARSFCDQAKFIDAVPYWRMSRENEHGLYSSWRSSCAACLTLEGRVEEAAQLVAQQAEAEKWSPQRTWYQAAKLWERAGEQEKARECYEKAECPPKCGRVGGKLEWAIEETINAHSHLADVGKPPPVWEAELCHFLGDCARESEILSDAGRIEDFTADRLHGSSDVLTHHFGPPELAKVLESQGKHDEARNVRNKAAEEIHGIQERIEDFGEPPRPDNNCDIYAHKLLHAGAYQQVVDLYKLVGRDPNYGESFQMDVMPYLPDAHYMLGNYHEALRWHKRIVDDSSVSEHSVLKRALFELAAGDCEEAVQILSSYLDRTKSLRVYWYGEAVRDLLRHIGTMCSMSGDDAAIANCLKEAEKAQRIFGVWVPSVLEYFHRGLFGEMERVCREEDELDVAAYLYEKAGEAEDAVRIYEEMAGSGEPCIAGQKPVEVQERTLACTSCGKEVEEDSKFCVHCGAKLGNVFLKCSKCGIILPAGAEFCKECGAKIG